VGDLYERLKAKRQAQPSAPQGDGGLSIGEFLGNVGAGARDLGVGIASLGFNVVKDIGSGVGEGVQSTANLLFGGDQRDEVQREIDDRYNFATDDLLKAMLFDWESDDKPVNERALGIVQAITEPYGFNPLKGDFTPDAGMAARHAYEDPVAVLTDLLAGAGVAGKVASGAARVGARVPGVADDLSRIAQGAEGGITARAVTRLHPGAPQRAMGQDVPLGGEFSAIDEAGRVRSRDLAANPVRRLAQEARLKRRTESVDAIAERIGVIDEAIRDAGDSTPASALRAERDILQGNLNRAQAEGVDLTYTPRASSKMVGKLASRIINESSSKFVSNRDELMGRHREILSRLSPEDADRFHLKAQGLLPVAGQRLGFDDVAKRIADEPDNPVVPVVAPHVERIRSMEERFSDPDALMQSDIADRIYTSYVDNLKETSDLTERFKAIRRPGVSYRDAMTPDEVLGLEQATRAAAETEVEMGKRFVEIVGGEPLAGAKSDLASVIDDTRLLNLEREASQYLDAGGSYSDLFERLYLPERVKRWKEDGLDSIHDAPSALDLDDARRAQGLKAPAYFPHYESLLANRGDFLQGKSRTGMGRKSTPKSFRQSKGRLMKEYLEDTKDAYITDPNEAYGRLAAEIANHDEAARLIDRLKSEFGVKITARDQLPEGWVAINPDALKLMVRRDGNVRTKATKALMDGDDPQTAFLSGFRDEFETAGEDLKTLLDERSEIYAVPKVVADKLDQSVRSILVPSSQEGKFRIYHDAPVNVWRATTLYLRPGFYINNIGGNSVFLGLQGGKLSHVLRQANSKYRKAVKDAVRELGVREDVEGGMWESASLRSTHLGRALDEPGVTGAIARTTGRLKDSKAGRVAHAPIDGGQRLNSVIENAYRRESFLTAAEKDLAKRGVKLAGNRFIRTNERLNQIMKYGYENPKAVGRWVDDMHDTMNNYRAMSPFERKVMRRFVAPFWSFFRHAATKLVKLPVDAPGKAEVLRFIAEMDDEINGDTEVGFLDHAFRVGKGKNPEDDRFFSLNALNPFGGLTGENPIGQLAPIPKTVVETLTGRSLYDDQKFTSPDVVQPYGTEQQWRMDDGEAVPTTVRPLIESPTSALNALASQFPLYKLGQSLIQGGARYDTGELIENPDGSPKYPVDPALTVARYLGIPLYDLNAREYEMKRQSEAARAQAELLRLLSGQ
jgi:hypothetical protein